MKFWDYVTRILWLWVQREDFQINRIWVANAITILLGWCIGRLYCPANKCQIYICIWILGCVWHIIIACMPKWPNTSDHWIVDLSFKDFRSTFKTCSKKERGLLPNGEVNGLLQSWNQLLPHGKRMYIYCRQHFPCFETKFFPWHILCLFVCKEWSAPSLWQTIKLSTMSKSVFFFYPPIL